ncbi:MAG: enolase C-terminal domain-like protein [Lautropia sp.]
MAAAPGLTVESIDLFERDVRLRMPFRFGVVTLTAAPQAYARVRIGLADGRSAVGASAELLAPKWFDKDQSLSNDDNFDQLRCALAIARDGYLGHGSATAWGHFERNYPVQFDRAAERGLNRLVAGFGPALIDRAIVDALCRALDEPFHRVVASNRIGLAPTALCPDLADFDADAFLAGLARPVSPGGHALAWPPTSIAARHTVGLVDPIRAGDLREPVGDGLPETLEDVVRVYGHRWFKLKVGGRVDEDIERLASIAAVLDTIDGPYHATLDGNEQYDDVDGVLALWDRMQRDRRLARLVESIVFVEQPIRRSAALSRDVGALSAKKPVIIDESDDALDAFVRARDLGYDGVSSKTCKGLYKSMINQARCRRWNAAASRSHAYLMSAEDLTIQPGLALQQDLALVSLLGITHVERNGHHYVDGMATLPAAEQAAFLDAHPDLYERSHGAVRVRIREGMLAIGSLSCAGYASGAMPDWTTMRPMALDGWKARA